MSFAKLRSVLGEISPKTRNVNFVTSDGQVWEITFSIDDSRTFGGMTHTWLDTARNSCAVGKFRLKQPKLSQVKDILRNMEKKPSLMLIVYDSRGRKWSMSSDTDDLDHQDGKGGESGALRQQSTLPAVTSAESGQSSCNHYRVRK